MASYENYSFQGECEEELSKIASEGGFLKGDIIEIKEIMKYRDKIIMTFFNDPALRYGDVDLYYVATGHVFQAGIALGNMFKKAPKAVKRGSYLDDLFEDGAWAHANPILEENFGMTAEMFGEFFDTMYDKFMELLQPFLLKDDPGKEIIDGVTAFLRLGISIGAECR